ncbi:beta-amylase [Salvia divinorum]|uniref:Beta-amylase n=1 Tax=Salvia divinorum TaxID=28513 RepID=A0ABD1HIV9_SALDI
MFGRYGFSLCCACFEMQDVVEEEVNPSSRPEGFLKQLLMAAKICDVPFEGQNCSVKLNDESFQQMLRMAQLYSDGLETPSFSFNFVRLDKHLFESGNWAGFASFVRKISCMNMFRGNAATSSSAAFAGAVLEC